MDQITNWYLMRMSISVIMYLRNLTGESANIKKKIEDITPAKQVASQTSTFDPELRTK